MRRLVCLAMLLTLAVFARGQDAPETYDLRPRFKAGQTSRYDIWTLRRQTNTVQITGPARTFSTAFEIKGEITWTVERVKPDGGATCVMTMDWLTADVTDDAGKVHRNDSRKGAGDLPPVHGLIRALAGVPLKVEVAADGSITSVAGTDAMKRKAGADVPIPDDEDFKETASDLATLVAAPEALTVGKGWSSPCLWNHEMGKLRYAMNYTLSGVEDIEGIHVATVNGTGSPKLEPDLSKLPQGGPKVEVRSTAGKIDTQVSFDLSRREAVGRNTVQTTQVVVTASFQGQSIRRTIDETVQSQALRIAEE